MELHNLPTNKDITQELTTELEQRVADSPLLKRVQQEEEMLQTLKGHDRNRPLLRKASIKKNQYCFYKW
ncbi:hypothetical protein GZ78_19570 [Endozoicomonas numazuensis]|uniref:Uncharacterized protein n=1 Tax=Endozoicomonas numazuensis TaxID=1137799 RepID=A0A081NEI8_9GAMM|nr:hypothetical protein GZ78_19570 [Endozoicomonas numazuensis]